MHRSMITRAAAIAALVVVPVTTQAQPVITNIQPFKGTANTGATVDVTGTGFGALSDVVQFPGGTNVNPVTTIPGGVRVTVPATWSGLVYVWNGAQWSNGFAHDIYYSYSGQRWPGGGLPFTWFLNNGGAPGCTFNETRDALIAGYAAWECASGLTTTYGGGTATATTAYDGVNCRFWQNFGWSPGTIAVATWWYVGSDIVHSDIAFNSQHFTWAVNGSATAMDVGNIGTHEEGHTIGLLDMYGAADSDNTMSGTGANGELIKRTLDIDDQYGAEWMYAHTRANFAAGTPAGWYWTLVPRNTADATGASAPLPGTLNGNTTTYLNAAMTNNGSDCVSPHGDNNIFLDGEGPVWNMWWDGTWGPGATYGLWTNLGTFVRGGRHTVAENMDVTNLALESNEGDNTFSTQYVWSPYVLADHTPVFRSAPPDRGGFTYPNCDGFQFTAGGYWGVAAVLPVNAADDYDIFLHNDVPSSTNGFDTWESSSAWGSGYSDFVLVNGNNAGGCCPTRWMGANLYSGGNSGFYAQLAQSPFTVGTPSSSGPYTIGSYDIVGVHEIYFGSTGWWDVQMDNLSGSANLAIALYSSTGIHYSKSEYVAYADSYTGGVDEMFMYNVPATGWYGLVVFKNRTEDLGYGNTYNINIAATRPNLRPDFVAGWDYPLVPRNDATAVDGNVHLSAQLNGNVGNTYFNSTGYNDSPVGVPFNHTRYALDGVDFWYADWGAFGGNLRYFYLNPGPITVRGGRHTLQWRNDWDSLVDEGNEADNNYERQFVWSPLLLADESPVQRPAPPWTGTGVYPNADGYRYAGAFGYAWAVATCPEGASDDYDLVIYSDYSGPESGYSIGIVGSGLLAGQVDYAGGSAATGGTAYYPASMLYSGGSSNVVVDAADANPGHISGVPATWNAEVLAFRRLIDVFEVYLNSGTTYQSTLTNVGGGADLAFEAHAPSNTWVATWTPELAVNAGTGGANEASSFVPSETGWYVFTVHKAGSADVPVDAVYNFSVTISTVAVDDAAPVPEMLALHQNEPNPFNPMTTIQYDVPRPGGEVRIDVYDLSGKRVRSLVAGHQGAGYHTVIWDGRGDSGEALGSGVYFYRMKAGSVTRTEKMMMVK